MSRLAHALAVLAALAAPSALAADPVAASAAGPMRVTVDTVGLIRLGRAAQTVYVANPAIADVTVESARQVFVLGKRPGETNLIVLDGSGQQILATAIVVVPPQERSVTVTRGTTDQHLSCAPRCAPLPGAESGAAEQAPAAAPATP